MSKSGLADGPFFSAPPPQSKPEPVSQTSSEPKVEKVIEQVKKIVKPKTEKVVSKASRDTVIPRHHDTTVASNQASTQPSVHGVTIDLVRKAVKEFGKEAATHRFTEAEKRELADLIYTYKNQGIRTNENEITRIAVNFVMEDYRVNGENSVLHKILEALND